MRGSYQAPLFGLQPPLRQHLWPCFLAPLKGQLFSRLIVEEWASRFALSQGAKGLQWSGREEPSYGRWGVLRPLFIACGSVGI